MIQTANKKSDDFMQEIPGLPKKEMTARQQAEALKMVQSQAEQRVKLGAQLFKAAEAHTKNHRETLHAMRDEQAQFREQFTIEIARTLQAYDQWVGQLDEGFTKALHSLEDRINTMQASWQATEKRVQAMLDRSDAMLEKSYQSMQQTATSTLPITASDRESGENQNTQLLAVKMPSGEKSFKNNLQTNAIAATSVSNVKAKAKIKTKQAAGGNDVSPSKIKRISGVEINIPKAAIQKQQKLTQSLGLDHPVLPDASAKTMDDQQANEQASERHYTFASASTILKQSHTQNSLPLTETTLAVKSTPLVPAVQVAANSKASLQQASLSVARPSIAHASPISKNLVSPSKSKSDDQQEVSYTELLAKLRNSPR